MLFPLVISGVGGTSKDKIIDLAKRNEVDDYVIMTPFVENAERNMLIKNSRTFLFASLFESFGMPPIEAMLMRTPVLSSKATSLEEVTFGLANYIDNPLDIEEWSLKLNDKLKLCTEHEKEILIEKYGLDNVTNKYLELFICSSRDV